MNEIQTIESAPAPQSTTRRSVVRRRSERSENGDALPLLLTVDDAADLLRTTRRAIYAMLERRQLPGVLRIRRRVLIRSAELLLAAGINSTVVAGENLTVGSTVWLPAESVAPGR